VSHFALDAMPHWGKFGIGRRYLRVAVSDGLAGLAVMGAMTALAPRGRRAAVLAGMAGAALPHLDKRRGCSSAARRFRLRWTGFTLESSTRSRAGRTRRRPPR
jgi:hypothetical protein